MLHDAMWIFGIVFALGIPSLIWTHWRDTHKKTGMATMSLKSVDARSGLEKYFDRVRLMFAWAVVIVAGFCVTACLTLPTHTP